MRTLDGRYELIEFAPDDVHVNISDREPLECWSVEWTCESWEEAVAWLLANGYRGKQWRS